MKSKQVKKYLGKTVTFKDVWGKYTTAKLIEVDRYFATFKKDNQRTLIKTFNIEEIKVVE